MKLGAAEAWTISNDRFFGHSFHVHDVQFKIVSHSDGPVADYEQGWKDTLHSPRSASADPGGDRGGFKPCTDRRASVRGHGHRLARAQPPVAEGEHAAVAVLH